MAEEYVPKIEEYCLEPTQLELLHKLLKQITELLTKNNIVWWLFGGSVLSIGRGGKVPWDDDEDLGVFDLNKVRTVLKKSRDLPFGVEYYDNVIKVFYPNGWIHNKYRTIGTPTVDIFKHREIQTGAVVLSNEYRKRFPNARYNPGDFWPLQKVMYNGIECFIPHNFTAYLDRFYPNWQNIYVIDVRLPPTDGCINNKNLKIKFDAKTKKYLGLC